MFLLKLCSGFSPPIHVVCISIFLILIHQSASSVLLVFSQDFSLSFLQSLSSRFRFFSLWLRAFASSVFDILEMTAAFRSSMICYSSIWLLGILVSSKQGCVHFIIVPTESIRNWSSTWASVFTCSGFPRSIRNCCTKIASHLRRSTALSRRDKEISKMVRESPSRQHYWWTIGSCKD